MMTDAISRLEVLPARPSAVLRVAIADAKKIFATPGYSLDMGKWHRPLNDGKTCAVCFAGAVMAGSFGADPSEFKVPTIETHGADERKLVALDAVRRGNVFEYVRQVVGRTLTPDETAKLSKAFQRFEEVPQPRPGTKGTAFLRTMAEIATKLESIGW